MLGSSLFAVTNVNRNPIRHTTKLLILSPHVPSLCLSLQLRSVATSPLAVPPQPLVRPHRPRVVRLPPLANRQPKRWRPLPRLAALVPPPPRPRPHQRLEALAHPRLLQRRRLVLRRVEQRPPHQLLLSVDLVLQLLNQLPADCPSVALVRPHPLRRVQRPVSVALERVLRAQALEMRAPQRQDSATRAPHRQGSGISVASDRSRRPQQDSEDSEWDNNNNPPLDSRSNSRCNSRCRVLKTLSLRPFSK